MYETTVNQFVKMLGNLSKILDKAAAHADTKKFDVKNILNARLAPDQFHFIRQVQISCDVAKAVAARTSGVEVPRHEDTEQDEVEELKARIQKTIDFIRTIRAEQYQGADSKLVAIPYLPGKALPAPVWVAQMAIPNFYFHMTTAYSILRHNGVDLGKGDYLGHFDFREL